MSSRPILIFSLVVILFLLVAGIPTGPLNSAQAQDQEKKLIAGRNVNMVSGTTLPGGDPWLQRQNEPSIAASTRNPLRLFAAANDYRTVDMRIEGEEIPGQEEKWTASAFDAWLGVFKSFDGGQSWTSGLLPGFPQDLSNEGKASPLKYNETKKQGFMAAADPVVRAGPNGIFYLSGIAFNRTRMPGWVNGVAFVARFIDKNDTEAGDSIKYIDTKIIATDQMQEQLFVDKPWIAIDVPKKYSRTVTIDGQKVPAGNVYIAYSLFTEIGNTQKSDIVFRRSTDCGQNWEKPIVLSKGHILNQGATIAIDPRENGHVYVAWRRFDTESQGSAIIVAKSTNEGKTFDNIINVASFAPFPWGGFDQPSLDTLPPSTGPAFRTNSYPTMAIDDKGRIYLAWAQRGFGPTEEARILLATSKDGFAWTAPAPIETLPDVQGHQFMPSLTFAARKLTMVWYDQREDFCGQELGFGDWIRDDQMWRHTIDVWAAQADTKDYPYLKWTSTQVSRYLFSLEEDPDNPGEYIAYQAQFNPPNYPLFKTGTVPFHSDYLDITPSPMFVLDKYKRWHFNTKPSDNPLFHVSWTDNRDVRPPSDGDWEHYVPANSTQSPEYITPNRPECTGGQKPGMRNQNVYTARITTGIEAGSPTNTKALDLNVPRSFVIFVKNTTEILRSFRLMIANQPVGGQASFLQFDFLDLLDVSIAPFSTIARQVFVDSTDLHATVTININEIDIPGGSILPDGIEGSVTLNDDPSSTGIVGGEETHEPVIENPHIRNWFVNTNIVNPHIRNEDIVNTDIVNPNIVNIAAPDSNIVNPNVVAADLFNPHIRNADFVNPNIVNPHIRNPHIRNANPEDIQIVDVEWPVLNTGNTASSFTFKIIAKESLPEGLYAQLIVYKVHYTPAVAGEALQSEGIDGCELKQEPHHEILLNVINPNLINPNIINPNILDPHIRNAEIENATFVLGPGEEAIVDLRIIQTTESQTTQGGMTTQQIDLPIDIESFVESVGAAVTAQSVDTQDAEQGIEEPQADATTLIIGTSSLPPGIIDALYPPAPYLPDSAQLKAVGGTEPYSWWVNPADLPPGLGLNPSTGQISGTPQRDMGKTYPCTYNFIAQVTDSGSPQQSDNQSLSITIEDPVVPPPPLTITTTSPLPIGTASKPYGTALQATGGTWPYTWTVISGSLPPGLLMDSGGFISGTPGAEGTYFFRVRVTDSGAPSQLDERDFSLTIQAATAQAYTISGTVSLGTGGAPLAGVLMRGLPSAPSTNASGFYSDTVPEGWSGTATPFKAGYYFVPSQISYANVMSNQDNQNYAAYPVALDHFEFDPIDPQNPNHPFTITINAKDSTGNVVTTYSESNTLSDTTGTISPKSTGAFLNGVWTGQVTISKSAPNVMITTTGGGKTGLSNTFSVSAGMASSVKIEDAPDGTGSEVNDLTISPGYSFAVYAISRDGWNNFVGNVAVNWSLIDITGGVVPGDLVTAPDNKSGTFTAHGLGTAKIQAQHALGIDTTGIVTVSETMPDDIYEENDSFATATEITLGTHTGLVLNDEDWFKFYVPAGAGKDLRIRLRATSYPDPNIGHDLDFMVLNSSEKLLSLSGSGSDDEFAYICDVPAGWYYVGQTYVVQGVIYSLSVELSDYFDIGYISGRVTDEQGNGIEDAYVELYGDPYNVWISRPLVLTDANGYYKIGYTPGNYTVRFNLTNFYHRDPYMPDVNYIGKTYNSNQVITLAAGETLTGIDAELAPGGTITGRVTGPDGNGISNATVYVYASNLTRVSLGITDADGNYLADRLRTGNYKVRFRPSWDMNHGEEWYDERNSFEEGLPVPVQAGSVTPSIDAGLDEGAYIEGQVTDGSNPIEGVIVTAYDVAGIGLTSARTDSSGFYRFRLLPAGGVKLFFNATEAAGNYISEYYPDKLLIGEAVPVPVQRGQTTYGINAQLAVGGTITGRVTGPSGNGLYMVPVFCQDTNSDYWSSVYTNANGDYSLGHLPPDTYKVRFRPGFGNYAQEWYDNVYSFAEAQDIPVGPGETIPNIDAQVPDNGGFISGRVTDGNGTGIEGITVWVRDNTVQGSIATTVTTAGGYYTVPRIPTSEVKVYFDADTGFLNFASEYYNDKLDHASADIVYANFGQTTENINAYLASLPPPAIATESPLPEGQVGVPYSASLQATGGRQFYAWSVMPGSSLPDGLTLNSKGEIQGTPTTEGPFHFTVRVIDSANPQNEAFGSFDLTIQAYSYPAYVIAGTVLFNNSPLPNVVMSGLPGDPVTNDLGQYTVNVSPGWSGTVTPTLAGKAFTPPNRTYTTVASNFQNEDYTATLGWAISGAVTLNGSPLQGVLMSGLPGEPRTNASGFYTAAVPDGWSATVIPTLPGFTFDPPSRSYTTVTSDQPAQDYAASFQGGQDDALEENDDFSSAAAINPGFYTNLVLADQDWFRVYVDSADAGKDLKVHIKGISYPNPNVRKDLDFMILNSSGKLLSYNQSGGDDETAYICDVSSGWYYIGNTYWESPGTIYSLSIEIGKNFGISYIQGRVTDEMGEGIENVYVELYGEPFHWDICRPLVTTDASGYYKVGFLPGNYTVRFNLTNNYHRDPYMPDVNYIGKTYNSNEVITILPGATITGIDAELAQGGTISGRITDPGGNGLASARVDVHAGDSTRVAVGLPDSNGYYLAERLRTGNYKVRFRSTGPNNYALEWYDSTAAFEDGLPVPVQAGSITPNIDAQLENWETVEGFIEGQVTDTSGTPLRGIGVIAYDNVGQTIWSAGTDDTGHYRLRRLAPGQVKIFFNAQGEPGNYVSEYYSDKYSLAEADPVSVQTGQTTYGIDAQLAAGGTITGRVTDAQGNPYFGLNMACFDTVTERYYVATYDINGNYTLTNLPPGNYKVRFRPTAGNYAVEWFNNKGSFAEGDVVSVAAGETTSGIDAQITDGGGFITGRVTSNGTTGIEGVQVWARDSIKQGVISSVITDADGNYALPRIPNCQAKVFFNTDVDYLGYASEYYNDKISFGTADLVSAVLGETTPGIDAVLAPIPALTITTTSLPNGQLAAPYNISLQASGGRPFYYWSIDSGELPHGLTLNAKGEIRGTPTSWGNFLFTVRATDSTNPQQVATQSFSLNIQAYAGPDYLISGRITLSGSPLAGVLMAGLPGAPITNSWGEYITVVPLGWSGTATPTLAGYMFIPESRSYISIDSHQENQNYEAYVLTLHVTTDWLLNGTQGFPYSQSLEAAEGTLPYSWSIVNGALPEGLTIESGGLIHGTPTSPGTYNFTVRVTDSSAPNQKVENALSITIHGSGMISETPVLYWKLNEGDGTTAQDSSGKGNPGTINNNVAYTVDAIEGSAVETYTNGWITANTGGGQFYFADEATIMAYVKIVDFSLPRRFVWKLQYNHPVRDWPYTIELCLDISGNMLVLDTANGLKEDIFHCPHTRLEIDLANPTNDFNLGEYNQIAVTIKGDQYKFFINGIERLSGPGALFEVNDNIQCFWVTGANWSDYWLGGKIDEVAVFNRTFTPLQVEERYTQGPMQTISGGVFLDGGGLSGVVLNGLPGNPVTNQSGEYIAPVVSGWSGTVSPALSGYAFEPSSRPYSNVTSEITGENYQAYASGSLRISTGSLPGGTKDSSYSMWLQAINGVPPFSWSIISGWLPNGLTLSSEGEIGGTPTEAGDFSFRVRVIDSSSPQQYATRDFGLTIAAGHQGFWTTTYPSGGPIRPLGLVIYRMGESATIYAAPQWRGIYKSEDGGGSWSSITDYLQLPFDRTDMRIFLVRSSNEFYTAGHSGMFKSTDAGQNWTNIGSSISSRVTALALHPTAGNTLYAGTENGQIFKSEDGGLSWANMSGGLPSSEIRVIAVNPADTSKVYAGTFSNGIYRSINGGAWESANGTSNLRRVEDIAFHPTDSSLFYLAGNDSGLGDGIFKTTDAGLNWTNFLNVGVRWEPGYYIAIDPTSPEIIYVVSDQSVYKHTEGGPWTQYVVASTNTTSIVIDPNYPETLYVGTDGEGVFKSTNGAGSWTEVNNGIRAMQFMHCESHSLHVDVNNPDIIYAGSINGGYRSTNGGATWEKMDYPEWTISSMFTRPERSGQVFTLGSRLWISTDSGSSGSWFDPSDGNFSCSGDGDLGIAYESEGDQIILYAGITNGPGPADGVFRSTDGGVNWELKNTGLTNPQIDTLAVHPTNPNIIFVGTQHESPPEPGKNTRLYRTLDGGENWQHIICGLPDFLSINQIVFCPGNPNIMYLGAEIENGGIYRSDDGGGCWYKVRGGNINTVAVHPTNPNIVYAGAWNAGGFYFSLNGGQSWSTMNGGLPIDPGIDSMALDPTNPYHVFIGTTAGVYEATFAFDFAITTTGLPTGIVGEDYGATLEAFGGTPPYTWEIISGGLPPGLDLNPNTGEISGLPTTHGSFDFRVKATENGGQTFTKNLNITILNYYVLDIAASPSEGGSVNKSPDEPRYIEGIYVDVSATPNSDAGYMFTGWSGDASGRAPLIHVQMTRDKNITANFALIADLPDYHIDSSAFPAAASAGQIIGGSVSVTAGNVGAADLHTGGISVGLYLSSDPAITTSDILLWKGRSFIAPLGGGASAPVPIDPQLQIPTTISAGDYYIGVLVDESDVIAERDEDNNTASRSITISSGGYDRLEMLGGWPYGSVYGIELDPARNLAVIGNGGLFQILDVSYPPHPVLVSQLSMDPSLPTVIKIASNRAYVAAGGSGLKVIDIADPLHPNEIGSCNTIENARSVDISGDYAYVTDHHQGFRVIGISDPEHPSQVAFLPFPGRTRLIKVSGKYAYVTRGPALNQTGGESGVRIIDISDPHNPSLRALIPISGGDMDVDSSGRYLFIPTANNYLRIYDVSDPDAPFEAASYTGTRYPTAVTIVGNRAYVPDQTEQKLVVLDISDIYHPVEVSTYWFTMPVQLWQPRVAGNLCFISSWYDSLRIVDFSNMNAPQEVGFYDVVGLLNYADVTNTHAFVATTRVTGSRLKVLDMSSLPNISETASLNTPYPLSDLVASGNQVYLPAYDRGLRVVDISNPSTPVEAGAYEGIVEAQDIAISGKYAYVADGASGLRVFDISPPSGPVLASTLNIGRYVLQVALSGRYAYLAANWGGLRIIDISDPFNPWQVGSYQFDGRAVNVSVAGDYAYVNENYNLLRIVDVSNPASPFEVSTFNLYYTYGDIGISGHYIFAPDWLWGVRVIDVSNPASPIEVEVLRQFSLPEEVIVRENRIYIVNRDTGFYVTEFRLH